MFLRSKGCFCELILEQKLNEHEKVKEHVEKNYVLQKSKQMDNINGAIKELIKNCQKNVSKTHHRIFLRDTSRRKRNQKTKMMISLFPI